MDDFRQTPERASIINRLETAKAELERAAEELRVMGSYERARQVQKEVQHVAVRKSLIAQDWHLADAAGEQAA